MTLKKTSGREEFLFSKTNCQTKSNRRASEQEGSTVHLQGTELSSSLDVQNKRRYKSLQLPGRTKGIGARGLGL